MTDLATRLRAITPARLLLGRSGTALPTQATLHLRADHAAARDAVAAEADLAVEPWSALIADFGAVAVETEARSKAEYLRRPDLGRRLSAQARTALASLPANPDLQIVIGDGLSPTAVAQHAPRLLPLLLDGAHARGWRAGSPIIVLRARVGVMNDIGMMLRPKVVVLLIGERPGLTTAASVSAYLAWQPSAQDTDANRNVISNIHAAGVTAADATQRILAWAEAFMALRMSGTHVKEPDSALLPAGPAGT